MSSPARPSSTVAALPSDLFGGTEQETELDPDPSLTFHDEGLVSTFYPSQSESGSSNSDIEAVDLQLPDSISHPNTQLSPASRQLQFISTSQTDLVPFKYRLFTSPVGEIRLLRILPARAGVENVRCEIFHTDLASAPPFKALSYTWGSPKDPQYQISLNDQAIDVRENLHLALQHLHAQPAPITIWIDALCINQSDVQERNEQVAKMKSIYEQAEEVVIWLGPAYKKSHLAFQLMTDMYTHRGDDVWIAEYFEKREIKESLFAIYDLIDRDYWYRMWICQELTVAKSGSLHCGADTINVKALDETQRIFLAMEEGDGYMRDHLFDTLPTDKESRMRLKFFGIYQVRLWQEAYGSQNLSFFRCIAYNIRRESTDPKDMVYGLAALANTTSKYFIEVDYSLSVAQIYTNLARQELEHCETLNILTYARSGPNIHILPSWVPDWTRMRQSHYFLNDIAVSNVIKYSASGDSVCDVRVSDTSATLFLKGITIGKVETLGEQHVIVDAHDLKNAARAFLSWWALLEMTGGRDKQRQERFGRTLAINDVSEIWESAKDRSQVGKVFLAMFVELCEDQLPTEFIDRELAEMKT